MTFSLTLYVSLTYTCTPSCIDYHAGSWKAIGYMTLIHACTHAHTPSPAQGTEKHLIGCVHAHSWTHIHTVQHIAMRDIWLCSHSLYAAMHEQAVSQQSVAALQAQVAALQV